MPSHGDGKGYMIPDDPEPVGDICIRVIVPNDVKYIAALWGAYQYFTTWKAWQRDEAKTGKICAARWKTSFDIARADWESGIYDEDCNMPFDVRQSTVDPCILEKTTDGVIWSEFAIINLCDEVLVEPPFPEGGGELPGSDAVIEAQRRVIIRVNDWRNEGKAQDLTRLLLVAWMEEWAVGNFVSAANEFVEAIYNLPTADVDLARDSADWQSLRDGIFCDGLVADDGHLLDGAADAIFDGLNTISADLFILLGATSAAIFDGLNSLASVLGGGGMTNLGTEWVRDGSSGGVGFGSPVCDWVHTFDFVVNDGGWAVLPHTTCSGSERGIYVLGSGWSSQQSPSGFLCPLDGRLYIQIPFTSTVIKSISANWAGATVDIPGTFRLEDNTGTLFSESGFSSGVKAWAGSRSMTLMKYIITMNNQGQGVISSVTVTGEGVSPF